MGERNVCKACNHEDRDLIEEYGRGVMEGRGSWRQGREKFGLHPQSFKTHMEKHVVAPQVDALNAEVDSAMDRLVNEARQGLMEQFRMASDDVKPLVLVAIHNLDGLRNTKTSQENLVRSLKTIQEMTGMKNEQRMLLGFANAMFAKAEPKKQLPEQPIIDIPVAEIVEEVSHEQD